MKSRADFYEDAHAKEQEYFRGDKYHLARQTFIECGAKRILDVGCGEGAFLKFCMESGIECFGIEISQSAIEAAKRSDLNVFKLNIDEEEFPFEQESFDAIFCGEVIEHVFDPDHLLDECLRVLRPDGILILTTPNLSSWFNRILLLFGYQPLFTEVSTRYGVGHPFNFWLKAGHIRIFTYRALMQLLTIHDFKIIKVKGFGINPNIGYGRRFKTITRVLNAIFRKSSLSSDLFVVAGKK